MVDEFTCCLHSRVYINSSMFRKHHQTSLKAASNAAEESVVHPLPALFRLLGLTPFKKVIICHLNCFSVLLEVYWFDLIMEVTCAAEFGNVNSDI